MEVSASSQLIPNNSFRGGEYIPMWADTNCRLYRLDRRFLIVELPGKFPRVKDVSKDFKGAFMVAEAVVMNGFIYAKCYRYEGTIILKYDLYDWKLPGTRIDLSGQPFAQWGNEIMTSDGTFFYFTNKTGHDLNDFVISKYDVTENGLSYLHDIICGDKRGIFNHIKVSRDGSIYAFHWHGAIHKFNPDGSENYVYEPFFNSPGLHQLLVIEERVYVNSSSGNHYRLVTLE